MRISDSHAGRSGRVVVPVLLALAVLALGGCASVAVPASKDMALVEGPPIADVV